MRFALSDTETICISFSGGADSLALLHLAHAQFPEKIKAVHFEHGFRGGESLRDATFCRKICEAWHIPFQLVPLNVPQNRINGEGDEEAARRLRLNAWKKIVTDPDHTVVLLGHHADDAAETLFIRLFRGSNVSGLTALREKRTIDGITFLRPLLDMTRADIEAYLLENGITEWCEDSTNRESVYLRNFLRNDFLPELAARAPYASGGITRSIQCLADDADLLEQMADAAYARCRNGNTEEWKALHPALLVRVLRRFLGGKIPAWQAVERLEQELKKPYIRPVRIDLGQGIILQRRKNTLKLQDAVDETETLWNWRKEPDRMGLHAEILLRQDATDLTDGAAYFDADLVPEYLRISPWHAGDKILSFDGKMKNLKKLFCDLHISDPDRYVLRGPDDTVYQAIGVRNSAVAKVTEQTKSVLRITGIYKG